MLCRSARQRIRDAINEHPAVTRRDVFSRAKALVRSDRQVEVVETIFFMGTVDELARRLLRELQEQRLAA